MTRPRSPGAMNSSISVCPLCSRSVTRTAVRLVGQRPGDDLDDVARAAHDAGCSAAAPRLGRRRHARDQRPHGVGRLRAGLQPVLQPLALQMSASPASCAGCSARAPRRSCCRAPCASRSPPPGRTAASSNPCVSNELLTSLLSQLSAISSSATLQLKLTADGVLPHHRLHHPEAAPLLLARQRRPCRRAASASSSSARTASAAG